MHKTQAWLIFVFVFTSALYIFGQAKTTLTGDVTDERGSKLDNVIVELVVQNGRKFSVITNSSGKFSFDDLVPGQYSVTAQYGSRDATQQVTAVAGQTNHVSMIVRVNPCSGLEGDKAYKLTESDRAEIVGQLVTFITRGEIAGGVRPDAGEAVAEFLLVPDNLQPSWLTANQLKRVKILSRSELQERADKLNDLNYFRIYPLNNMVRVSRPP